MDRSAGLFVRGCFAWLRRTVGIPARASTEATVAKDESSSSAQRRKYHHFRPVLHLRHFAGPDGTLWVYDREAPADPFQQIPERVGGEKYLYAPGAGDDPTDDVTERWLAEHIDAPAAAPIRAVLEGRPLTNAERSALAAYVAVQDMRTPTAKHVLVSWYQDGVNRWLAGYKADPKRLRLDIWARQGVWYDLTELGEIASQYEIQVAPGAWTEFIHTEANRMGARLHSMAWYTIDIPAGARLPANDIGVVKCMGQFERVVPYRVGFALGATHWIVPLSPKKALCMSPAGDPRRPPNSVEWARLIARQTVEDSMRFVYADRQMSYVTDVLRRREPRGDVT